MLFYFQSGDINWASTFALLGVVAFMVIFAVGLPVWLLYKSLQQSKKKNLKKENSNSTDKNTAKS